MFFFNCMNDNLHVIFNNEARIIQDCKTLPTSLKNHSLKDNLVSYMNLGPCLS